MEGTAATRTSEAPAAPAAAELEAALEQALSSLDFERLKAEYWDQNEALFLDQFLPPWVVGELLAARATELKSKLNRNFIPGVKKGGSVSYYLLAEHAPIFLTLYKSPAFIRFLSRLVDAELMVCPEDDPHACALYYYTEPGDYIGGHFDTSYYKGARYTILLGIVERSPSCQLVCQIHKDNPERETREVRLNTHPGTLVIFNGNKLWHSVTPLAAGEERIVLTLEYVTNPEMGRFQRIFSNLKDAFAYFGIKTLFMGKPK